MSDIRVLKIADQAGMATLTATIIGGILVIMAMTTIRFARGFVDKSYDALLVYNSIEIIKANIYAMGANDAAWRATVAANKAAGRMACVDSGGNCATSSQIINLYDANGTLYYDPLLAAHGFKLSGEPCTNYSATSTLSGCIIKVQVYWRPFCAAPCIITSNITPTSNRVFYYLTFSSPLVDTSNPLTQLGKQGYVFNPDQVYGVSVP